MNIPRVNLGQSEFQDTFMVVGEELTPYRKLRKIELELRELQAAIKTQDFAIRKSQIKLDRLDLDDELHQVEAEEIQWEIDNAMRLYDDAKRRLANFEEMKRQLIEQVPQEYWDQGFEQAEAEHWVAYYIKRAALDMLAHGSLQRGTMDQIMVLPDDLAKTIMSNIPLKVNELSHITIEADKTHAMLTEAQKQLEEGAEAPNTT